MTVDDEFERLGDDLRELDRYAIVIRYPGVTVKADTAEEALKQAERVRAFTRQKLRIR
jgi:HEPN domain-containing protein